MPTPKIDFEVDTKLPLEVRNAALDFTDRWHDFEASVLKAVIHLSGTAWTIARIKVKFQSTSTPEPEELGARANIQLNASSSWRLQDYMEGMLRELIVTNTRTKLRRQFDAPLDEEAYFLLSDMYARQLLSGLMPSAGLDFRPSVAHFLSVLLPSKYPQMDREKSLERAPRVRELATAVMNQYSTDTESFYDAYKQLKEQLKEELSPLLASNL